ncbi:Disease resistance RPP8-like protein 3 [Bienertia sinuspersici]
MSEPTITVVVKRIRSLLDEESEILEPAKNRINVLLSNIENLTSYLNHADENRLLMETANKYEDAIDKFIYKMTSENRERCSFLRRFLVERAHECEDVIDDIIYKIAHERRRRSSFLKRYTCKPSFQIDPQHKQKIEDIIKRLDKEKSDMEKSCGLELKEKPTARSGKKTQMLPPTTSYPHKLVGLAKDINSLVEKLTRKGKESVLYIVGMEGSGKTTLVAQLSNHPAIKEHFKSLVWVSALQKRDAKNIFLEILEKTRGTEEDASRSTTTEELGYKISNVLEQRPYMIIIEDVEDPDNLATHMFRMIQRLDQRSKIVITTCATPRHPYKHEEYIVSPDENIDSLTQKLTKKKIHKTSIFYMPAKQATILLLTSLYEENTRLKEHFDSRAWVNIDEKPDERSILLKILQEITRDTSVRKESAIDALMEQLKDFLAKKSSLIVLDQVQEARGLVGHLHFILKDTDHQSKVIIMTNNPPTQLQENEEQIAGVELLDTDLLTTRLTGEGEQPSLFSIRDFNSSGWNTNMARELYNHQTVKQHFQHRIWITVSREWDAKATLLQIIKYISIDNTSIQDTSTKKLVELLIGVLEEKRYLLVLDDMGDAEDLVFDLVAAQSGIKTQKKEVALNSKIIITVGNPRTLRHSSLRCLLYEMRPLTEEESWTLLCSIVFNHTNSRSKIEQVVDQFNRNSHEEKIKRITMLKSCNGIPLAIVALGGLLSTKETVDEWETVSNFLGSEEMWSDQALENILLLCYSDLPSDIIPCFLYFSLFPQHSEIPAGTLIRMWLAEGLVTLDPPSGTQLTLENMAAHYLEELACRKFKAYPTKSSKLRTLVQFGRHGLSTKHYYFQHEVLLLGLEPIHEHFKLLKVLVLCGIRTSNTLPEQIGDLIFLTYLGLKATSVQALPESIQNLRKLNTLDYRGILSPTTCKPLPDVLLQLTELRHVYLPEYAIPSMKKLALNTSQNLQILWGVSGGNWVTTDLVKLSAPLVKLGIVNISCNEELEAVVTWLNMGSKQLQVLKLDWHRSRQDKLLFPDSFNNLLRLRKLALIGRLKEEFNFKLLSSLVKLELFFSHLKIYDPTDKLGDLPLLKILLLWNSYEGIQWICGKNMFPKLEELQISHLPNLEEWKVAEGAMPYLKRLSIFSCRKLLGLPEGLKYLKLQELKILNMPRSFCSRLQEIENENTPAGEDISIIQNIPYVKFEACKGL